MDQSDPDDPRTWSIDRVVYEFCKNNSPPWTDPNAPAGCSLIPDRHELEDGFRKNHIDGKVLLELTAEELRIDLGIPSLGQRRAVVKAINFLAGTYVVNQKVNSYLTQGLATPDITQNRPSPSGFGQSPAYGAYDIRPTIEAQNAFHSPYLAPAAFEPRARTYASIDPHHGRPSYQGGVSEQGDYDSRRQVHYPPTRELYDSAPRLPPTGFNQTFTLDQGFRAASITSSRNAAARNQRSTKVEEVEDTGYLDVIDANIDRSLEQPRVSPLVQPPQLPSQIPPEEVAVLPKPKKRAAPSQVLSDGYLGETALPMQSTFYGVKPSDDESFFLSGAGVSNALKEVVSRRLINSYYRRPVPVQNTPFTAWMPYSRDSCARPFSVPQFTLITPKSAPGVERTEDWPTLKSPKLRAIRAAAPLATRHKSSNKPTTHQDDVTIAFAGDGEPSLQERLEALLQKYPTQDDDEILPLYGDSGDENEYDEDTWAEMEAEKEDKRLQSNVMTADEVNQAIDQALTDYKKLWGEKQLPRVQVKAFNIWMRAARALQRQPEILQAQRELQKRQAQLMRARNQILLDQWTNANSVKFQCQSLEETMNGIWEQEYFLEVLDRETPPGRPPKDRIQAKPRKRFEKEDDEETIGSDSDVAIDDFIVDTPLDDDRLAAPTEEDFNPVLPTAGPSHPEPELPPGTPSSFEIEVRVPDQEDSTESTADEADIDSDDSDAILSPLARSTKKKRRSQIRAGKTADYGDSDSDWDAPPTLPNSKYVDQGASRNKAIDLTFSDSVHESPNHSTTDYDVRTPELNPVAGSDANEHVEEPKKSSPKIKLLMNTDRQNSSTARDSRQPSKGPAIPGIDNVAGIRAFPWHMIEERSDHVRALRKCIYSLEPGQADVLNSYIFRFEKASSSTKSKDSAAERQRLLLHQGLLALGAEEPIPDVAEKDQNAATVLTLLFLSYACDQDLVSDNRGPSSQQLNDSYEDAESGAAKFFEQTKAGLVVYVQFLRQAAKEKKVKRRKLDSGEYAKQSNDRASPETSVSATDDEKGNQVTQAQATPRKKRKRPVAQSQEALAQQRNDQQRIKEQEKRRLQMEQKFGTIAHDATAQFAVNFDEPYVSLNQHIAQRVKLHQIEGIRFLWREIIDDPKHQGCLLAHTMGLGKTMQVISLLVTIRQCVLSNDQRVRAYIPETLLDNRVLILCPPSLLENWFDELLMWAPKDLLGPIRKITGSKDISEIQAWAEGEGVCLLSYDLFRWMINPPKGKGIATASKEDIEKWLLEEPTLVVADEAHKMKNAKSKLTLAASRFKTKSRIALTGSPLNNHLEEYHTMIDWVASGYLGSITQFKSKYSEPIIQGLYADSNAYERRLCLKKLHVLKKDLEPKVNRADISAIRKDMPPKTEYFLTIPLTDIQRTAYNTYVGHLLKSHGGDGAAGRSKLLAWLGDLLLLCNHPSCFEFVCNQRREEHGSRHDTTDESGASGDEAVNDEPTDRLSPMNQDDPFERRVKVSRSDMTAMEAAASTFDGGLMFDNINDPALSYRTLIVQQIVQRAAAIGDKTLIFSHSIPSLNYLELMLEQMGILFMRIDGTTKMSQRQQATKAFNKQGSNVNAFLISTKAGGLGLNLQGANRVILFDFNFNPMWEEQAIGRAYRLGQRTAVYVYRFRTGGTFEDVINNKAVFKSQLFSRVVDKKNPERYAKKSVAEYMFDYQEVEKQNYEECLGKDPGVLDSIIVEQPDIIRNIELTETFQKEDDEALTEEELKLANAELEDEQLKRNDLNAWNLKHAVKQQTTAQIMAARARQYQAPPPPSPQVKTPGFAATLFQEPPIPNLDGASDDPDDQDASSGAGRRLSPSCDTQ